MSELSVPDPWRNANPATWTGLVLMLGGTDTGKSTAVRFFSSDRRASRSFGRHATLPPQRRRHRADRFATYFE